MNVVEIFLLIGVAHWAAHIIECKECRMAVMGISIFVSQAAVSICGWPLALPKYLAPFFRKGFGPPEADVERIVDQVLKEAASKKKGRAKYHGVLTITQRDGETDEAFQTRSMEEMTAHANKIRDERSEKGDGPAV